MVDALARFFANGKRAPSRITAREMHWPPSMTLGNMDIGTFILFSNLSRHQAEIFSAETTPDMAVANAARMSMSISLFFESLRFNGHQFDDGDYYVDGGLYNNYPIHIFDQQRYVHHGRSFSNGINWETLGLFLY